MSVAAAPSGRSVTADIQPSRAVRLIRVIVLALVGTVIAFSATLHEQLRFDLGVTCASLAGIGVAHAIHAIMLRGSRAVPALLAAVAIIAAVTVPFAATPLVFAITVAAWALVSSLLEFVGAALRPGSRQNVALLGGIGILLALLALLFRDDQVAILGFFGGYAIIAAVFLGISAFDTRRPTASDQEAANIAAE